jgi:RNA polymerase sigma-70 factor (ECF subfamily)
MSPELSPPAVPSIVPSLRALPDFVDRLIANDEDAFAELVRAHGPRMLAVATRYLPQRADAEDALQDALAAVVHAIAGFRRASSLETWLHRIVVNAALTSLRRGRHRAAASLAPEAAVEASASPWRRWPAPSALEVVADAEMHALVRAAVRALPASQRAVLLLRDVEALELRAIAHLLDVGLTTVKSRLHHARHALQGRLGPHLSAAAAG